MNIRRFSLIISSMVSLFLFVIGLTILSYLIDANDDSSQGFGNLLGLDTRKQDAQPFNFLFFVGDKEECNTDTMLLINYDPKKATLNALSLPRDTRVKFKGYYLPKLNSAYSTVGINKACDTVSNLVDANIKYYVYINLETFREIIDNLGGVDYYVPVDLNYDDPSQNLHIHIKKGQHHMDGKMAEEFLRYRHPNGSYSSELMKYYDGSDIKRTDMQLSFIKELVNQKAKLYNIAKINSILNVVFKNMKTNITLSEVLNLSTYITKLTSAKIHTFRLDGQDRIINDIWYFLYNGKITDLDTKQASNAKSVIDPYFPSEAGVSQSVMSDSERSKLYDLEAYASTTETPPPPKPSQSPKPSPSASPSPSPDDTWDSEDNPSNGDSSIILDPSGEG